MSTVRSKIGARLGMAMGSFDVITTVASESETALKTVCAHDHAPTPVKQSYNCPTCAATGKISDFSKAREQGKGLFVVVPPEELAKMQVAGPVKDQMVFAAYSRTTVEDHVVPQGKPYYLRPSDAVSAEPYALFKKAVQVAADDGKIVLAIWSAKGAPVLWKLIVLNNVLAVQPLCWPNQLDVAPEIPDVDVSKYDGILPNFIESISSEFNPDEFRDERATALQAFVSTQTAVEGITVGTDATSTAVAPQIDLMAALAATVAGSEKKKAPAKKTAAKRVTKKAS